MTAPEFSVIIPTCDRHLPLTYAIRSVLNSHYGNFEIIVSDNYGTPGTYEAVRAIADPRVRYFRTGERVGMSVNWEFALAQARGDYVFFLGDDDALMPDALGLVRALVDRHGFPAVSWRRNNVYWWPDCITDGRRDFLSMLFYPPGPILIKQSARAAIQETFRCTSTTSYEVLPMVYNSFIRRDVIEQARKKTQGVYFAGIVPDLWSGLINAWHIKEYCFSRRPLSIAGVCGKSTGWSVTVQPNAALSKQYFKDSRVETDSAGHPALPSFACLELSIAASFLRFQEALGPEADGLRVDFANLARQLAGNLVAKPDQYREYRAALEELCQRYSIDTAAAGITIPPQPERPVPVIDAPLQPGPRYANGDLIGIHVYCPACGVYDVAGAAKLLHALLPPPPVI